MHQERVRGQTEELVEFQYVHVFLLRVHRAVAR
jgi:hypothetical protein